MVKNLNLTDIRVVSCVIGTKRPNLTAVWGDGRNGGGVKRKKFPAASVETVTGVLCPNIIFS